MIKGKRKIPLTIDNVLKLITPYDLYKHYFGDFKINVVTKNWMRGDENPSFIIGNATGELHHFDFADSYWRGDAFSFIQQMYGISSMDEVLKKIDADFGLGICSSKNIGEYKRIKSEYKQPEEIKEKHYSIIQCVTRKFTQEELKYWSEYYIDIEDLKREHIYSLSKVYLNRKLFPLKETELRFGYYAEELGKWKVYRPHSSKKNKWFPNNIPNSYMEGKENIINCGTAFINKSRKDRIVVSKVFPCSCSVQNEGISCFPPENVEFLKANSDRQILSFDADVPGVTNSQQITKLYDFEYCNVPRKYLAEGIKDWADLAKTHGLNVIEEHLKLKGVI